VITTGDLKGMLLDLSGMGRQEIERLGSDLYRQLYLNKGKVGVHRTHDGQDLVFHSDAFDHAFYTSSDRRCHPDLKDVLRTGSVERIRWIGHVVSGCVQGSACFEVPSPTGRERPPNRFYAVFETPYVVWLEPRQNGGWKFKSAYPLSIEEIRRYQRGGRTVWKSKEDGPMIKLAHGAPGLVQGD
jgi:hypothetical protein